MSPKEKETEQARTVDTPYGAMAYVLVRKSVKNMNLRVGGDGHVTLSVPRRCPLAQADQLIRDKSGWLRKCMAKQRVQPPKEVPAEPPRAQSQALLTAALERVYPLVAPLGVAMPELKLRRMRSQWGNCHWKQGYITLNTALARCPEFLQDYVALHELVHFLHPDHGGGFYASMDQLMPDWKTRRKALRPYAGVLISQEEMKKGDLK